MLTTALLASGALAVSASLGGDPSADARPASTDDRTRTLRLTTERVLQARARAAHAARERKARRLAAARQRARTPQAVICRVFGRHCREALAVARCESGYRTDARNGQYLGLFQMGDWARSVYGHGNTALVQARAAYRLFVDTGRTWRPWSCKPW